MDVASIEGDTYLAPISKKITGNIILVAPMSIQKKLNRIEFKFKDQIVSKNLRFVNDLIDVFIIFEGSVQEFQKIVVEINSIKEIKNFRYLIIN